VGCLRLESKRVTAPEDCSYQMEGEGLSSELFSLEASSTLMAITAGK
jgi:hypothetical protein